MRMRTPSAVFASVLGLLLLWADPTAATAQATAAAPAAPVTKVGDLVGNAERGKKHYRRYCAGCHGDLGNGLGENAQWIDPKPRDFTAAIFECRSTPTGTLPTDEDLYNSVSRGFVTTNMPPWFPLPKQTRIDAVAYIKTLLPALGDPGAGHPDHHPSGNAGHRGKHSPWAGAVPEDGVLEVSRAGRPRRRSVGLHAARQQGQPDPALQFQQQLPHQVRLHQRGPVPGLHDGTGRHADALLRRQPATGRGVGPGAFPPHPAAGQDARRLWPGRPGSRRMRTSSSRSARLGAEQ